MRRSAWWRLFPRTPKSWGSRELEEQDRTFTEAPFIARDHLHMCPRLRPEQRCLSDVIFDLAQRGVDLLSIPNLLGSIGNKPSQEEQRKRRCLSTKEPEKHGDKGVQAPSRDGNRKGHALRVSSRPAPQLQACASGARLRGGWLKALPSSPLPLWGRPRLGSPSAQPSHGPSWSGDGGACRPP